MKKQKHKKKQEHSLESPDHQRAAKSYSTSSQIDLAPFYGQPKPGEFPYVRGPYTSMYRGKLWTMRQYSGFGSAKETNERFRYLLKNGQTGLSCAFDLPTQMGYDSDHPMAAGEVGRVGVAISTLEDMEILLHQLPLDKISTSMTINATATSLLAFYVAVAKKRKITPDQLRGTIQNDILKEYIARGTYIFPPEFSLKLIADSFRWANQTCPKWNTISISGYHIREAGSTAAQEIAFTLQNAFTYVDTALKAGLSLESFVPRLSFFFNVHNHLFEEVAKFRVARKIYAEEMQKRFNAPPHLLALRFHAQTAGSTLTAQQPMNNIMRVAYQALSAVLGGTQSLHTNSFDEALGLPTEESALIALRTQQVLAEETGVPDVADPLAGSYYLESLTLELENKSRLIIEEIDRRGGMLRCIEQGYIQREIQQAAFQAQKAIDSGTQGIVGVNCHQMEEKPFQNVHRLNPRIAQEQVSRLKKFKARRKAKAVETSLKQLESEARRLLQGDPARVCESIANALENKCTLGEVSDIFRGIAGRYQAKI